MHCKQTWCCFIKRGSSMSIDFTMTKASRNVRKSEKPGHFGTQCFFVEQFIRQSVSQHRWRWINEWMNEANRWIIFKFICHITNSLNWQEVERIFMRWSDYSSNQFRWKRHRWWDASEEIVYINRSVLTKRIRRQGKVHSRFAFICI